MGNFQTIGDVWKYINSIPMFSQVGDKASNFGLENIARFCERIGNPHKKFRSIHVAGTNGKGSTCYLLEAVLQKAGYKTGMFTSPHLLRYNERVRISGKEVPDQIVLKFFQEAEIVLAEVPLTYFEISTALAFWVFCEENIDIAIIETGLGGRQDSTNIIQPELSIITSIGKDHEKVLGNSIDEISLEKAGIIKMNTPIVVGNLDNISMKVIEQEASKNNSQLFKAGALNPDFDHGRIFLKAINRSYKTNFIEPVNAWNVAIVSQSIEVLNTEFKVPESALIEALEAFHGVPARFEKIHPLKEWYFSGAHNEQAIDAMLEALNQTVHSKKVLILSIMKDKVKREILSKFEAFNEVFFYEQSNERSAHLSEIEKYIRVKKMDESNYKMILNEFKTELVIFAGSFYFYPTVKRWLNRNTEKL